jgi:hypothetical protein
MTMTPFFLELHAAYQSELDDLATDSEGRDVLQQRLREKRREIGFLAQMMELSPEMVAVVFHRGFQFREPAVMEQLLTLEADEFPDWDDVLVSVQLHPWAQDLAAIVREQPAGEWFLTVAAVLEYLQGRRVALPAGAGRGRRYRRGRWRGPGTRRARRPVRGRRHGRCRGRPHQRRGRRRLAGRAGLRPQGMSRRAPASPSDRPP